MKSQLSILLATMQANWLKLTATIGAFLMPISGLLFLVGFVIVLDTITGVWKSIKNKVKITSRGLSAIISKMLLYEITVIMFYMIDQFILNNIILQFFSVELLLTKVLALILVSIEVMSINENYKAVKGLDLWQSMKNLFARAKDIKKEVDEIRHKQDITGTPI
jgi:Bacteriophage holin family